MRAAGPLDWLSGDFFRADPSWVNGEVVETSMHFFRNWSEDRHPAERIMSMKDAADFELENARKQMAACGSPVIVDVTHDGIIMVLREKYLGQHFTEVGLSDFLDSAGVRPQASGMLTLRSPTWFRELSLPTIKEAARIARENGIPSRLYAFGKSGHLVEVSQTRPSSTRSARWRSLPWGTSSWRRCSCARRRRCIDDAAAGDQCGRDTPFENLFMLCEVARS